MKIWAIVIPFGPSNLSKGHAEMAMNRIYSGIPLDMEIREIEYIPKEEFGQSTKDKDDLD